MHSPGEEAGEALRGSLLSFPLREYRWPGGPGSRLCCLRPRAQLNLRQSGVEGAL